MKYALERMDHLIRIVLQPAAAGDIDPARAAQWIDMTVQEKENVVAYLVHKALNSDKGQEFAVVVRHNQAMISQLMDFVYAQRNRASTSTFKQFVRRVLDHLEELLLQIKERYHEYFDRTAKVPEPHLQKALLRLRKDWTAVERKLQGLVEDKELGHVLFSEIPSLLSEERVWRFCDLSYTRHLVKELNRFSQAEKGSADDALWHLLVYYNFNRDGFINYLTAKIDLDTRELGAPMKAKRLGYWLKQINQQASASFVGARPDMHPVKAIMSNWLSQEIYWEEQQVPPPVINDIRTEIPDGEVRLHFGVSVDVLTLLVRAAKDSGLIKNEHLTQVFKVLAQTCRTTYQEKPSAHSMLKKSYVAERGDKEAAIDWLHLMLKKVHGY